MRVAESAFSAGDPDNLLSVFQDLYLLLAGFLIAGNGAKRYVNDDVFAVATVTIVGAASLAIFG